jgi:hypothetical protein
MWRFTGVSRHQVGGKQQGASGKSNFLSMVQ